VRGYTYGLLFPRDRYMPWHDSPEFQTAYGRVKHRILLGEEGGWELWDLIGQSAHLEGDAIEVGSYRGGSAALMALRMQRVMPYSCLFVCDTFAGVANAGVKDSAFAGGELKSSRQGVESFFESLNLANIRVVPGVFPEESLDRVSTERIVLANVDVDTYRSSKNAIAAIAPRMPPGGIIALGDYGFANTDGVTELGNELKGDKRFRCVYNLNGRLILVKVAAG
jgi:O-methyltransferase